MAKGKFVLNRSGIIEMFKSDAMQSALDEVGAAVAQAAKAASSDPAAEFGYRTHVASFTAIVNVFPANAEAVRGLFDDNALIKGAGTVASPTKKIVP